METWVCMKVDIKNTVLLERAQTEYNKTQKKQPWQINHTMHLKHEVAAAITTTNTTTFYNVYSILFDFS